MNIDNVKGWNIMEIVVGIVGMITGVIGLLISIFNFHRSNLEALNLYFSRARDKAFVEGKKIIYRSDSKTIEYMKMDFPKNVPDSIVEVMNFYHHWGLMLKHHQLPMWLFYDKNTGITSSGTAVTETFVMLKPLIYDCYRTHKNPKYAEYYEFLYNEIDKRVSKAKRKAEKKDRMRNKQRKKLNNSEVL